MARPLRFEIENAWHHVTARGNERRAIFRDVRDRRRFMDLTGAMARRFGVVIGAYVLMDNHYHLVVRTPAANLSRAIQWLNVCYSMAFNRRHRRCGHLFQGRFKSVLVDENEWLGELTRYVHLNPVRTGRFSLDKRRRAETERGAAAASAEQVRARLDGLRQHSWSSYGAYVGRAKAPEWLDIATVLSRFGGRSAELRQSAYRQYVESAVRGGIERNPWENICQSAVLGAETFLRSIMARLIALRGEAHRIRRAIGLVRWEDVRRAVERIKGEPWEQFFGRHGDWGRDLALCLGRRRCGLTHAELAARIGGMKASAVTAAVWRIERRMRTDKALRRLMRAANQML